MGGVLNGECIHGVELGICGLGLSKGGYRSWLSELESARAVGVGSMHVHMRGKHTSASGLGCTFVQRGGQQKCAALKQLFLFETLDNSLGRFSKPFV